MKNNIECCTPSIVDLIREKGRNCNGVNILFEIALGNNENSDERTNGSDYSYGDSYGDSWGDSW